MSRTVWVETSNVVIGAEGFNGLSSCAASCHQRDGGHLVTALAQHWIVTVGNFKYQAGSSNGYNRADRTPATSSLKGCARAGKTRKTDDMIQEFIHRWNERRGGKDPYNLITNSCQTFAVAFVHFLCDGHGKLPQAAGVHYEWDNKHVVAAAGLGEVAAVNYGGAKAALSAPNVGFHEIRGQGTFVQAELLEGEVGTDTPYGRVGAHVSPNVNTGAGYRNGNFEATLLGFGARVGQDGFGVRTPLAGADCSIM
jgi:hypothetical protein